MHYLFSYGTLQLPNVQLLNYGRLLNGTKDTLSYYKIEYLTITNKEVLRKSKQAIHPVAVKTNNSNDSINGIIFEITEEELQATDQYEVSDYIRVLETFNSGKQAWIYIARK